MEKRVYTPAELATRVEKAGKINRGIYDEAASEGVSVSTLLEQRDPSDANDTMDAFQRQMAHLGIRTKSVPEKGIFADKVERFYASDQPASIVLFPEFINREMRQVRFDQDYTNEIIALKTPVDADVYRSIYVDTTDMTQFQMKRVSERTEIPTAKMKTAEQPVRLYKYGLRLEVTYEALRRMRIDQIRTHLAFVGLQTALDKLGTAVDVLINGDGNSNAATNDTTATLDPAYVTGILSYKAWIGWLMNFYPYNCKAVIGTPATLIKVLTMAFPGGDPLLLLAQYGNATTGVQMEMAQGVFVPIKLVISRVAPAGVLVGVDKDFALEELDEIGASLTETDKIISSQFNEIVLTEVVGYDKLYGPATRTLTIS